MKVEEISFFLASIDVVGLFSIGGHQLFNFAIGLPHAFAGLDLGEPGVIAEVAFARVAQVGVFLELVARGGTLAQVERARAETGRAAAVG